MAPPESLPAPHTADPDLAPAEYLEPSAEALAALDAGLKSAREHAPVYLGDFSKYAGDE